MTTSDEGEPMPSQYDRSPPTEPFTAVPALASLDLPPLQRAASLVLDEAWRKAHLLLGRATREELAAKAGMLLAIAFDRLAECEPSADLAPAARLIFGAGT